jgi:hypothetical protein
MNLGPTEALILLVTLAVIVVPIWGIVDCARRPEEVWARAGQSKVVWILLQLFLGIIGAGVYFLVIRPKLLA